MLITSKLLNIETSGPVSIFSIDVVYHGHLMTDVPGQKIKYRDPKRYQINEDGNVTQTQN